MDDSIGKFCKTLASFCNHLQSSCDALKQSVERRPIPLDSASSTFVQCLNRKVSSTNSDLNLLESMSFGTVSFEELLGHCNEVYKKNQSDIVELGDRLKGFGYNPEGFEIDEEEEFNDNSSPPRGMDLKKTEEDPLFEDSPSLKDLGLSDVCLATIASEANNKIQMEELYQPASEFLEVSEDAWLYLVGDMGYKSIEDPESIITVSKDVYESLPSYMKSLASWEDLLAVVDKMNSSLSKKGKTKGGKFFHQDEIASLDLGPKGRSYLLLLLRMNRLVVETIDGVISYRVLSAT
ncbi:unnamed protein product [Ilex paraguariensis]|uniref:Spindle and kinetochore-associated protein 3 n=1 Tax=Ilex paraguariensis TaxID=185542 RepID=A0ABC8QYR7_9AQUA